ncbi:MAG: hypothetical protein L0H36_03170 [bacterium]|nr:hypothetical protein [bacterium]MDN5835612.1 hypothetical protein [bacterium]
MSEEVTTPQLQFEAINMPDTGSFEHESHVAEARHKVDTILAAGALQKTAIEAQPSPVEEVESQVAQPEIEPGVETLTPLQIGINIEVVRRAALADAV